MKTPACLLLALGLLAAAVSVTAAPTPQPGQPAPNFTLRTLDNSPVELNALTKQRPVVLLVLRGWPGYQCPICTRQVQDFVAHAAEFERQDVQVLMVYPGPAPELQAHAREFLQDKHWPASFLFVVDPDFALTNAYGLRWNAAKETAYPSTFIIGRDGRVSFAQVSKSHGGRTTAVQVLAELRRR